MDDVFPLAERLMLERELRATEVPDGTLFDLDDRLSEDERRYHWQKLILGIYAERAIELLLAKINKPAVMMVVSSNPTPSKLVVGNNQPGLLLRIADEETEQRVSWSNELQSRLCSPTETATSLTQAIREAVRVEIRDALQPAVPNQSAPKPWTAAEVAAALGGVSKKTVRRLELRGVLVRINGSKRPACFTAASVAALLDGSAIAALRPTTTRR